MSKCLHHKFDIKFMKKKKNERKNTKSTTMTVCDGKSGCSSNSSSCVYSHDDNNDSAATMSMSHTPSMDYRHTRAHTLKQEINTIVSSCFRFKWHFSLLYNRIHEKTHTKFNSPQWLFYFFFFFFIFQLNGFVVLLPLLD